MLSNAMTADRLAAIERSHSLRHRERRGARMTGSIMVLSSLANADLDDPCAPRINRILYGPTPDIAAMSHATTSRQSPSDPMLMRLRRARRLGVFDGYGNAAIFFWRTNHTSGLVMVRPGRSRTIFHPRGV